MKRRFDILFEDEQLLILNKPPRLLTIPDRYDPELANLQDLLKKKYQDIWVVHRLDKETSGVICFAKTEAAHKTLSLQFEQRQVQKIYLGLLDGRLVGEKGIINKPIISGQKGKMQVAAKGKEALSLYTLKESFRNYSWTEIEIKTGRTHQIRVHFAAIGHPLAVDALYGRRTALFLSEFKGKKYKRSKDREENPLISRVSLHASRLTIQHPITNEVVNFEAPLPKDLRATLNQLRKWD